MENKFPSIKPLVIGIGRAGRRHLKAQLDLGVITGVYNIHPTKTTPFKGVPNVIVFDNLRKAINWSNLVHVCTPDDTHAKYTALAIKNKKAVLSEKPLTTTLKDALDLQDLSHKYGSQLFVGQNYRLTPTFLETKKLISQGALGSVTSIKTSYLHDAAEYKLTTKGNTDLLFGGGSHAIDLACFVANDKVVSVKASGLQLRYQITLTFASGIVGHIKLDASSGRKVSGSDLTVVGKKGRLSSHMKLDQLKFYKKSHKKPEVRLLPNTQTLTTLLEIKIVNEYLSTKSSHWPLPKVDEAVNIIRVLAAIKKAASSGKSESIIY